MDVVPVMLEFIKLRVLPINLVITLFLYFFFQAEDGIRRRTVTGVQTCALPISFGGELTRVAREVGTEGILGGQANVEGVSGVWKELTDNFNQLATSLTTQVRAIADVSTAVTDRKSVV